MAPRLKEKFNATIVEKAKGEFSIKNPMALPRLDKIIVTVGMGHQLEGTKLNAGAKEQVLDDMALICGQRAVVKKAKKSVSNFNIRQGYEIGAMTTLRGNRMWEFLDRLISMCIPRIKDFRGLRLKSFDGRGNYCFGITEQGIFPEINMASVKFTHGMNINLVFRNSTDERSQFVLREIGLPFERDED
ncbi:MAG: 50S ribosomal protein L5 [Phycisphaeraceae bacterium]|nr:50S ribosomal protein L5 [Phycisphaeraceae bacterium]|tara:strand:+ start:186 stop:749 length:564 start_codon:yes stop_codon:yes gene_type:complete